MVFILHQNAASELSPILSPIIRESVFNSAMRLAGVVADYNSATSGGLRFVEETDSYHPTCEMRLRSVANAFERLEMVNSCVNETQKRILQEIVPEDFQKTIEKLQTVIEEIRNLFFIPLALSKLQARNEKLCGDSANDSDLELSFRVKKIQVGENTFHYWLEAKLGTSVVELYKNLSGMMPLNRETVANVTKIILQILQLQTESIRVQELDTGSQPVSDAVFLPTQLQSAILKTLEGKSLKKEELAAKVCKGDGGRLYKSGGLKELMSLGLVKRSSGRGYYLPSSPPSDAIQIDTVPVKPISTQIPPKTTPNSTRRKKSPK